MNPKPARGFTLLEMLLAVALVAALLSAMSVFMFSMGEIWGRSNEQRLFDQHVRAVTRHVENLLRGASLTSEALSRTGRPVAPQEVRLERGGAEPLLTFNLPEGGRVLPWPEQPLPEVVCSLAVQEGQGLVLGWHSRLETRFLDDPARVTVLSPFGTGLSYDYYQPDFKAWQSQPRVQRHSDGNWLIPDRVTLHFTHGKMTAETSITLPAATGALPGF